MHKDILNWLELFGIFTSLIYVVLLWFKKRLSWVFAFIGSCIYAYYFAQMKFFLESIVSVIYAILAIVAFLQWAKPETVLNPKPLYAIERTAYQLLALGILSAVSIVMGFLLSKYTSQAVPYVDSFSFSFQCFATYLAIKKIRINWIYFIVIDLVMCYVYFNQDNMFGTGILYLLYAVMAFIGFYYWKTEESNPEKEQINGV